MLLLLYVLLMHYYVLELCIETAYILYKSTGTPQSVNIVVEYSTWTNRRTGAQKQGSSLKTFM